MRRGRFHGLPFQRRIPVPLSVHINLSLSGIGVSVGPQGLLAGDCHEDSDTRARAWNGLSVRTMQLDEKHAEA